MLKTVKQQPTAVVVESAKKAKDGKASKRSKTPIVQVDYVES